LLQGQSKLLGQSLYSLYLFSIFGKAPSCTFPTADQSDKSLSLSRANGGSMKIFIPLSMLLLSPLSYAEVLTSKIHSIVYGQDARGTHLVKLQNGRVAFIKSSDKFLTKSIATSALSKETVEINLSNNAELISIRSVNDSMLFTDETPDFLAENKQLSFTPTVLASEAAANKMFQRLNPFYKRISECSNRAHVWSYEEFSKNGIKTEKAFVFFTAAYINRNRFKWWFHVAPMVSVKKKGKIEKLVMDYRYNHRPVTVKEWTDTFVFSKRECKETKKFSEYDVNPQTEDCYVIFTPMHYWVPRDIHNQELINHYKNDFIESEVRAAYREAF
jgi:hypothetical protein